MGVTAAQIRAALRSAGALGGQKWAREKIAADANDAMAQAGITTKEGAAVFMAQTCYESGYYKTTQEYRASKSRQYTLWKNQQRYEPYIGRGVIQRTWLDGYRRFGKWAKGQGKVSDSEYFVKNPEELARDKWAWLTAVEYLTMNGCIPRANRGENKAVGRIIHAGPGRQNYPINSGERTREASTQRLYSAFLRAGITAPSGKASTPAAQTFTKDDVKRMQRQVGVTDDGVWGATTDRHAKAIRAVLKSGMKGTAAQRDIYDKVRAERPEGKRSAAEFRKGVQWALGVTADGIWGPNTEAAWQAMRSQHLIPAKASTAKKKTTTTGAGLSVDGKLGPATVKALQRKVGTTADGTLGPATVKALQKWLKVAQDGTAGPVTVKALQRRVGAKPIDGAWGAGTTKALQRYLNKG